MAKRIDFDFLVAGIIQHEGLSSASVRQQISLGLVDRAG